MPLFFHSGSKMPYRYGRFRRVRLGRRIKQTRTIGNKPGHKPWKHHVTAVANTGAASRQLFSRSPVDVPHPSQPTTVPAMNQRAGESITVKAIEINFDVMQIPYNTELIPSNPTFTHPIKLNVALISAKSNEVRMNPVTLNPVSTLDFFGGGGIFRGINFSDNLTSQELHYLPINKQRWNVHMHKRYTLCPYIDRTQASARGRTYQQTPGQHCPLSRRWYVRINRTVEFDDATQGNIHAVTGRIAFVWWVDHMFNVSGNLGHNAVIKYDLRMKTFFVENQNLA